MKMTSWGCCVLVYDRSGEPVVQANEPGLSRTDVSGSEFEVGAPTSNEEAERKKSRTRRATKSPLTAVLESWLGCFGAIGEEHFLEGTRLLSSLEKINSSFLRKEFRRDCRRLLEHLVSTIISTVAERSPGGQGLRSSVFVRRSSLEVTVILLSTSLVGLFDLQLLNGLLELGWVRGSEIEPANAEFHAFVR